MAKNALRGQEVTGLIPRHRNGTGCSPIDTRILWGGEVESVLGVRGSIK